MKELLVLKYFEGINEYFVIKNIRIELLLLFFLQGNYKINAYFLNISYGKKPKNFAILHNEVRKNLNHRPAAIWYPRNVLENLLHPREQEHFAKAMFSETNIDSWTKFKIYSNRISTRQRG